MNLTRRAFIQSLVGALAAPQLALPAPPIGMVETLAPELIAFRTFRDDSVISFQTKVVLFGMNAKAMVERDPHLWSAVMVERKLI